MPQVRFNHMELTVPRGTLDAAMRADLAAFYGGVLGWETKDVEIVGGLQFLMLPDDGQFILVAEHDRPMQAPGYDHLGLLCETRAEVDEILAECRRWADKDDRLRLKVYDDLHTGNLVVHAFYVKYLLPIWFDIQALEHVTGSGPDNRWQYLPVQRA
jgi:predicted enzyme related to lactoylglutathione lyase